MSRVIQALKQPFDSAENFAIVLGIVGTTTAVGYFAYKNIDKLTGPKGASSKDKTGDATANKNRNDKFEAFKLKVTKLVKEVKDDPTRTFGSQDVLEIIQLAEYTERPKIAKFILENLAAKQQAQKALEIDEYVSLVKEFLHYEEELGKNLITAGAKQLGLEVRDLTDLYDVCLSDEANYTELTKILYSWVHDPAHYTPKKDLTEAQVLEAYEYGIKNLHKFDLGNDLNSEYTQMWLNDLIYGKFNFNEFDVMFHQEIANSEKIVEKCEEIQNAIGELYEDFPEDGQDENHGLQVSEPEFGEIQETDD